MHHLSLFFFSSRRRHTRCGRDWSSDVCSSDLLDESRGPSRRHLFMFIQTVTATRATALVQARAATAACPCWPRSEERRVGKECRAGWAADQSKKTELTTWVRGGRAEVICAGDD